MTIRLKLAGVGISVLLFVGCGAVDDLVDKYSQENNGQESTSESGDKGTALGFPSPNGGYNVYGGNTFVSGGIPELKDYIYLGQSTNTDVFSGSYDYYAIGNDGEGSPIKIDSIKGSNEEYYAVSSSSNTNDYENLVGPPDGKYVTIYQHGYILIDASNDNLESIKVFMKK